MAADNINSVIRRVSTMVDTSGREPPRGIQMAAIMGGGVYPQAEGADTGNILSGRISLGIIGVFILGAMAFYFWTREFQGGG